jgi:hypothetical protein
VVGLSQNTSLLLLFVGLPFVVGGIVMTLVARRGPHVPPEHRVSEILARGELAEGQVLDLRRLGSPLDVRPMVAFRLEVHAVANSEPFSPFELVVTQAVPRHLAGRLRSGLSLPVRLSQDHSAGAVILPEDL